MNEIMQNIAKLDKDDLSDLFINLFENDIVSFNVIQEAYQFVQTKTSLTEEEIKETLYNSDRKIFSWRFMRRLFGLSNNNTKWIFCSKNKQIPKAALSIVVYELELYKKPILFNHENNDKLAKLLHHLSIYNILVKVLGTNNLKSNFYSAKNKIITKLIENNYLVNWHLEYNSNNNKEFYSLTFQLYIDNLEYTIQFHQPIEYRNLALILPPNKQTESKEYNHGEITQTFIEEHNDKNYLIAVQTLWKYIVRTKLM